MTSSHNPGDFFNIGVTTVTYAATDPSGNTTTANFDITVNDAAPPVLTNVPIDMVQDNDADACGAIVTWAAPLATDNCSITMTSSHNPGDFFNVGVTTVTYTATDPAGNITVADFDITVNDASPPVLTNIPVDMVQDNDADACSAVVTWAAPLAADNCSVIMTSSHNPGDNFDVGVTTVTYTATDPSGNSTAVNFDITVNDALPPLVANMPVDMAQDNDADACGAVVTWTAPLATDNCSVTMTSSHNPGDFFDVGVTTVIYTAEDLGGNLVSKSFTITIEDQNEPVFTRCPSTYSIESVNTEEQTAIITWLVPEATATCSEPELTSNYHSGQEFKYGDYTVTYVAEISNGKKSFCSFDITAGYNRTPTVKHKTQKVIAGQSIHIAIDAEDPDGDILSIASIENNKSNSSVTAIDYQKLTFEYRPNIDFLGSDTVIVTIADNGSPATFVEAYFVFHVEYKLDVEVSSAITSNGDMINDNWQLTNINYYPNNVVYIYDRWGGLIYNDRGYDNQNVVWSGNTNKSQRQFVESGTYFYVIDLGDGYGKLTGAVEVIR